jgi:alanine transaminase
MFYRVVTRSRLHPLRYLPMRPLTIDSLNPAVLKVEYAVRGELAIKAEEYRVNLQHGNSGLPFDKIINSNIGNPQQKGLDQPPITFIRQVCPLTSLTFRH